MEKQELTKDMGKIKKAVKKTKELSVALAESSSLDAVEGLPLTPRKRGRPRKIIIVEKTDDLAEAKEEEEEDGENKPKNAKIQEVEKQEQDQEQEEVSTKRQLPTRSRARRKGKPRKSS